jgi:hypothetical protein
VANAGYAVRDTPRERSPDIEVVQMAPARYAEQTTSSTEEDAACTPAPGGRHRRAPESLGRRLVGTAFTLSGYLGRTMSALAALAVLGSILTLGAPDTAAGAGDVWRTTAQGPMAEIGSHRVR